jgi:hypothetical protein
MIEYDRKPVSAVGLYDFCKQVEELFLAGYRFNFDNNELVPTNYGMMTYCVMEKPITPKSSMGEFTIQSTGTVEVATKDQGATDTPTNAETVVNTEGSADATVTDQPAKRGRKPKVE